MVTVCVLGEQLGVTKTIYINGMSGVREEGVVKTYSRVLSSHRARGFRRVYCVDFPHESQFRGETVTSTRVSLDPV